MLKILFIALHVLVIAISACADDKPQITEDRQFDSIRGKVIPLEAKVEFEAVPWYSFAAVSNRHLAPALVWRPADLDGDGPSELVLFSAEGKLYAIAGSEPARPSIFELSLPEVDAVLLDARDIEKRGRDQIVMWSPQRATAFLGEWRGANSIDWRPYVALPESKQWSPLGFYRSTADETLQLVARAEPDETLRFQGLERIGYRLPAPYASFLNATPGATIFLGDFDGDSCSDLARLGPSPFWWSVAFCGRVQRNFAAAPVAQQVLHSITGDFNGDGRTDIINELDGYFGWLGIFSDSSYGIEKAIASPFPVGKVFDSFFAADVNGDGLSDIVGRSPQEGRFWIARTRMPRGLAGISIAADNGALASSNQDGIFELSVSSSETVMLGASKADYVVSPPRLRLDVSARRRVVIFAAASREPQAHERGAAVRLGIDAIGPYVCTGYDHAAWNADPRYERRYDNWALQYGSCPPGYAVLNAVNGETATDDSRGTCCRLPASDILTGHHIYEESRCPPSFIVTGFKPFDRQKGSRAQLRCTKINEQRYRLGAPTPGVYWGAALGMRGQGPPTPKSKLPAALRWGIGRSTFRAWEPDGCVGFPWGSLYSGFDGTRCGDLRFQQLQYQGIGTDPAIGTPVVMFPDCRAVNDPYDPTTGCSS